MGQKFDIDIGIFRQIFVAFLTLNDADFKEVFFLEKWSLSNQIFFQMKI